MNSQTSGRSICRLEKKRKRKQFQAFKAKLQYNLQFIQQMENELIKWNSSLFHVNSELGLQPIKLKRDTGDIHGPLSRNCLQNSIIFNSLRTVQYQFLCITTHPAQLQNSCNPFLFDVISIAFFHFCLSKLHHIFMHIILLKSHSSGSN